MRYFYYVVPSEDDTLGPGYDIEIKSEDDIIREYGPHWIRMSYETGMGALAGREQLLLDWVTVHWAMELK